jgi:thioredoxin-like negative regulator of GroEL
VAVQTKQVHNFQRNGVEKVIQEARASFRKGDFAAARELFEQARSVRKSTPSEVGLANALVSEGNVVEAR